MSQIRAMTKRNLLIYFRDKGTVFFSVLSALIVLAIMVMFLGESSSSGLLEALNQYGSGAAEDNAKNASWMVQLWILGGILGINSVTVSMTAIGAMVEDEERGRLRSFYVTPASRLNLSLGYILSAWCSGMVICLITLAAGEGYFALKGHPLLRASDIAALVGVIALNVFTFSAIGYLIALFVRTSSAWSGLLTVVGTLVGFVGGTYISVSSMSAGLQNVVKLLPVIHGTALMRRICMQEAAKTVFAGMSGDVQKIFFEEMGVFLKNGTENISIAGNILMLVVWAVAAIAASSAFAKKRKLKDR